MAKEASKDIAGTIVLTVVGMTCAGCANALTRALSRVPGVSKASVDLASECASVTGTVAADDLIRAIEAAGFTGRQC